MMNDTANATILAILKQIAADCQNCARESAEAVAQMELRNVNGAVGALITVETEIERLTSLKATVLALHRGR